MANNRNSSNDALLRRGTNIKHQILALRLMSKEFSVLYPGQSFTDILNYFRSACQSIVFGDGSDWDSEAHMALKQFTQTALQSRWSHLPQMLYFQLSELDALHCNNLYYQRVLGVFERHLSKRIPTVASFSTLFKALSITVKKNVDQLEGDWTAITDLENLIGYSLSKQLSLDELVDKANIWGKGDMVRDDYITDYYQLYSDSLRQRFASGSANSNFKILSLSEFVANTTFWMTDGSSRGVDTPVLDERSNTWLKSRRTKIVLPQVKDGSTLLSEVLNFDIVRETYSVSEKTEPGRKGRCIISSHYAENVRLAYIEFCLNKLFRNAFPEVYFLQNNKRQLAVSETMLRLSRSNAQSVNFLFFPLDASAFDQEVSHDEVALVFDAVLEIANQSGDALHKDVVNVIRTAAHAWFASHIVINKQIDLGSWEHGVPSGIRWTALMDSIINCLRFDVCQKVLAREQRFGLIPVLHTQFQGDDMSLVLKRPVDALRILNFYKSVNVTIHPQKNFLSVTHNEFLRKIYGPKVCASYPNRMITKFMFRLPEKRGASNTRDLLAERVGSVFRLANRSNNREYFRLKVQKLFRKALPDLSDDDIYNLLTTATTLGGFGYVLEVEAWSPRTKIPSMEFDWPSASEILDARGDKLAPVTPRNLYQEQISTLSYLTGVKVGSKNLSESLTKGLDPLKRSAFKAKVQMIVKVDSKYSPGINTNFYFSNNSLGEFRPYMIMEKFRNAASADLYSALRQKGDRLSAVNLSDEVVRLLATKMSIRCDDQLFWDWVESKLNIMSFNMRGLNDVQRSQISENIVSTYFTRFLNTHNLVSLKDFDKINVLAFKYIKHYIIMAVKRHYILSMYD